MSTLPKFNSNKDEIKLLFEESQNFILDIKKFILKSNHFVNDYNSYYKEDDLSNFRLKSKITFEEWNSYNKKNLDETYLSLIGSYGSYFNKGVNVEFLNFYFNVIFFEKKIKTKKTIFGEKSHVLNEKVDVNLVYFLNIKTENGKYINQENKNLDWFINLYKKDNYIFKLDFDVFDFLNEIQNYIENYYNEKIKNEVINRKLLLEENQKNIHNDLDHDGNGEVDLVDMESYNKLLTNNQIRIIEIDKNYIQKFVKISIYLKTKKNNIQSIFKSLTETKSEDELQELVNLLKNQIHTYELLVFHSINMITSLVESDLITFYEIYECFDELGVFNSNWENEVSNKLINIGDGIRDLMYSIYQMENKIVNSIDNLSYVTQDSFYKLQGSVEKQLSGINSSIKFNNLLTGIQTYQMYKINQNIKKTN